MTIVEQEIMNHNEDLEVEIGNGGEDGDDPYDYPIDDEAGSDVDEPPHTGHPNALQSHADLSTQAILKLLNGCR